MSTWLRIATSTAAGPVCIAVTVIGLYLSYLAWRRKGARSAMRGVAWSLLPTAAWATHSVHLIGSIGAAIVQFAQGFVFSPKAWAGVILVGVSVLLFLVSGGIPLLQRGRRKKEAGGGRAAAAADQRNGKGVAGQERAGERQVADQKPASLPARRGKDKAADEGGLGDDVEAILRKHGIS
jgi:hypothetical protein